MGSPITEAEEVLSTIAAAARISRMTSYENNEHRITIFLSSFNQVFLTYLLLSIIISTSMEVMQNSNSEDLVAADYNFEIKTAMERTKNHTAFMAGIVALTFAAVVFVLVDWAIMKYKHVNLTVWDVYVFKK